MKRLLSILAMLAAVSGLAAQQAGLTSQQIAKASTTSWPTYNGDYSGRRFSPLTKINDRTVKNLSLAWIYDFPAGGGTIKATPLMVDGVLYWANPDHAYAVDARTGREL
jgi:alcohol dehydrogenase (cytochrome c)